MSTAVEVIPRGLSVVHAARRLRDQAVPVLAVSDPTGRVIGTITERDIVVQVVAAARAPELCPVEDAMSRRVAACKPDDDVRIARRILESSGAPMVLILSDRGELLGGIDEAALRMAGRADPQAIPQRPLLADEPRQPLSRRSPS